MIFQRAGLNVVFLGIGAQAGCATHLVPDLDVAHETFHAVATWRSVPPGRRPRQPRCVATLRRHLCWGVVCCMCVCVCLRYTNAYVCLCACDARKAVGLCAARGATPRVAAAVLTVAVAAYLRTSAASCAAALGGRSPVDQFGQLASAFGHRYWPSAIPVDSQGPSRCSLAGQAPAPAPARPAFAELRLDRAWIDGRVRFG